MAGRYEEVLQSLYRLEAARGMDFKLERTALALYHLGNPERRFRVLHIAGTNGKGSVAAMAHSILSAAGYRTGLYTSPHLVSFTERIRVGNEMIEEDQVVGLTEQIQSAATVRGIELTFFEFTTVLAFLHFAQRDVEIAVVEVGLGGRLDATNVVDADVAAITSIGLDHEEYLGNTIESVAWEKAGIIKPGRPVVVGRVPPEALAMIGEIAQTRGAPLLSVERDFSLAGSGPYTFSGLGRQLQDLRLSLDGAFQRGNAAVAIAAVVALDAFSDASHPAIVVPDSTVRRGLMETSWPGRLQIFGERPRIVVDCAHNPDAVTALVAELNRVALGGRTHLLFAVMRDKRWQDMVRILANAVSSCTVTSVLPPRGESAAQVAAEFRQYVPTETADDPVAALQELIAKVSPQDTVVVAGSLFLVGAIYPYLSQHCGPSYPSNPKSLARVAQ